MRGTRLLLASLIALAAAGCARQQQAYYVDPQTGQALPVAVQQPYAQQPYGQQPYAPPAYGQHPFQPPLAPVSAAAPRPQTAQSEARGLFSSSPAYAQQTYDRPAYAQPAYQPPPAPSAAAPSAERGLFNMRGLFSSRQSAPVYAQATAPATAPRVPQYAARQTQNTSAPKYTGSIGGPYVAAPAPAYAYAAAPPGYQPAYTLDAGDKLRIVVFGQEGITNTYIVGADGNVNLPLVGSVPARGYTTQELSRLIAERLKQGYVREPHVSVEIEVYRPFFILGEVTTPGQYPYVANMSVETAVAIAGGFSPRADKTGVILTHNLPGQQFRGPVPLSYPVRPGDTVLVKERWF